MLTGKTLYETMRPLLEKQGFEGLNWEEDDLWEPEAKAFYEEVAKTLTTSHITPCKGQIGALALLLEAYQRSLAEYILMVTSNLSTYACDYATFANWQQRKENLDKQAEQLLNAKEQ